MLNCLAAAVPGSDRIISAEEVRELRVTHPDWVALETRQAGLEGTGEITLRDLVRESLRMRPTRIIVGEVRSAEALDLLLALNSGLPGMATLHANSAREALVKLCTLPMLAGDSILKGVHSRLHCRGGGAGNHLRKGLSRPEGRWHERHKAARAGAELRSTGRRRGRFRDSRRQQVCVTGLARAPRVQRGSQPY